MSQVPHIWETKQEGDDESCFHLCASKTGAEQAYMLHHGLISTNKEITCIDHGPLKHDTERAKICFDALCVMYGLLFEADEQG